MFLEVPQFDVVMSAVPLKDVPLMVLAFASLVAFVASETVPVMLPVTVKLGMVTEPLNVPPVIGTKPISLALKETFPEPLIVFDVDPTVRLIELPQLAVTISEAPLNDVPLIRREVVSVDADVAVEALPVKGPTKEEAVTDELKVAAPVTCKACAPEGAPPIPTRPALDIKTTSDVVPGLPTAIRIVPSGVDG
jgi:hypothetical protein